MPFDSARSSEGLYVVVIIASQLDTPDANTGRVVSAIIDAFTNSITPIVSAGLGITVRTVYSPSIDLPISIKHSNF